MLQSRSKHPMGRLHGALALLIFLLLTGAAQAQKGADITGLWATEERGASVRITRCGRGFCGTLASTGEGTVDENNPNPALRNRRLVGLPVFGAGTPVPGGQEGSLYNPRDGKTYSGRLTVKGPDALVVSGCVLGILCRSQTWTRLR